MLDYNKKIAYDKENSGLRQQYAIDAEPEDIKSFKLVLEYDMEQADAYIDEDMYVAPEEYGTVTLIVDYEMVREALTEKLSDIYEVEWSHGFIYMVGGLLNCAMEELVNAYYDAIKDYYYEMAEEKYIKMCTRCN